MIEAGSLQMGQSRDFIIKIKSQDEKYINEINYQYRNLQAPHFTTIQAPPPKVCLLLLIN